MVEDRRRVERVHFQDPLPASIGGAPARLLDLGFLGARIQHERALEAGAGVRLEFTYESEQIAIDSLVARCDFQPILSEARGERVYFSGVDFVSAAGDSGARLKRLIGDQVVRALELQKANAHGVGAVAELADDVPFLNAARMSTMRAAPSSYVCCRYGADGTWKKTILTRPTQPADGFTVRLGDTEDEIERLCKAYEAASPEVRKLIRLCAEMSADDEDRLPTRQYKP